ncbi:hypothetical protein [Flavobacterium chungangensis]|uniref:ParB/Sulfiredoxin domain-containing protein n=1 Tax=Flavobacterium chungangensis TaxID=2708132 RepID=A0ABV8ZDJ9_9FLAO
MIEITVKGIKKFIGHNEIALTSTHHKLSLPVIKRMYKKMVNGIKFDDIKIFENLVIDGHHRYISSLLAEIEIGKIKSLKSSATKEYKWNDIEFDENDWDTDSKIQYLNERDAEYNQIDIETINDIVSE